MAVIVNDGFVADSLRLKPRTRRAQRTGADGDLDEVRRRKIERLERAEAICLRRGAGKGREWAVDQTGIRAPGEGCTKSARKNAPPSKYMPCHSPNHEGPVRSEVKVGQALALRG